MIWVFLTSGFLKLKHIENHFGEQLKLDFLANQFCVSTGYITQTMKKKYATTPQKYWQGLRLKQAERLLLETEVPVCKISKMVGYNNVSYFRLSFKKRNGLTPEEYRKTRGASSGREQKVAIY